MALDYDYLSASTRKNFIPQVADNIYNSSALFKMLDTDGRIKTYLDGGTSVTEGLEYAKITAGGTYSNYDLLDNTPPDNLTRADFNWGNYYASISISGDDEDKNMGPEEVIDLVKNRTRGAEKKIKDDLSVDLFSGTGGKALTGLSTLVGAGTAGGIDGATYTWWVSGVDTTSRTRSQLIDPTDTTNYMNLLFQAAERSCLHMNETPNLIVTTPLIWDIFESIQEADQRYNKNTSERGEKIASAGFDVLYWRNKPVIKDELCPAGQLYFLNTDYMFLRTHRKTNFLFDPFTKVHNQRARVAHIFHKTSLTITNRRMFYKFTGFPTS